ncbi:hypothetical protein CSC70_02850 [Pseudoxanthomonas kalamensis DSM 18571]|uniref:DUF2059 domain-containing protein n=1 Tax=Pseudoxanthomonas kalamensis TaxID=289483 RepID=UPI0013919687|nr:DUF2059 domain-containing protein [Pseudoxanthomonas kalamensis]KAF1712474.1 hypothetical protein CSC70_02850 [Pseudoxanthomonas kalamensis DSM 18571]
MLHSLLRLLLLSCLFATASALATPPSDAEIDRLLKASRSEDMLKAILPQIEDMQRQQFAQLTAGKELSETQQAELDRIQTKTSEVVHKALEWERMRPVYMEVYKQTFSSQDVRAITKFYESRAGRNLLDKTPALMQNLMSAVQQSITPMLQELDDELKQLSDDKTDASTDTPVKKTK